MLHGDVGVDGVLAIAGPLLAMGDRVSREQVLLADEILAAQARGEGPDAAPPACADLLKLQAQVWAVALDQDGAEPAERDSAFHRGVTLGRARNGIIPIHGGLMPEVAAQFQRICDSAGAPRAGRVRFDDPDRLASDGRTDAADGASSMTEAAPSDSTMPSRWRSPSAAATRDLPTMGGAAPTLVVSVREQDLDAEDGWAHAEGWSSRCRSKAARHVACSGVIQRVVLGGNGRILRLGTEERVFNRHQRRAIGLRDGGCIIPGVRCACGVVRNPPCYRPRQRRSDPHGQRCPALLASSSLHRFRPVANTHEPRGPRGAGTVVVRPIDEVETGHEVAGPAACST